VHTVTEFTNRRHGKQLPTSAIGRLNESSADFLGEAILELDTTLKVIGVNDAFTILCSMDRDELIGHRASDFVSDEIFDLIVQTITTGYFVSSPPVEVDLPWHPADGEGQRVLVSVTANPDRRTFLAAFHDVTEWQRTLSQSKGEEQLQALGEMVAGMAHEINNPLAAIMGLAQLSLTQDIDPSLSQDLQNILEQAKRAADVVGDLQTFAGAHKPEKASADLAAILNETVEKHYEDFEASNIVVETDIDPSIPTVQADPRQLKQVFNNLLTNARQAIEPAHRKGTVSVIASATADQVQISIADDGVGITPENLAKIFNPFFTTREVGQGRGLGLSVCHRIVADHGGRIRVDSQLGQGTAVTVELPQGSPLPRMRVESRPRMQPVSDPPHALEIMVVDDEPVLTDLIGRTLEGEGHTVTVVSKSTQVPDRPDLERFDLILMDIKMPDLNGIELYNLLPESVAAKVVFMTGDTANSSTKTLVEKTGNTILGKPFKLGELKQVVRQYQFSETSL